VKEQKKFCIFENTLYFCGIFFESWQVQRSQKKYRKTFRSMIRFKKKMQRCGEGWVLIAIWGVRRL